MDSSEAEESENLNYKLGFSNFNNQTSITNSKNNIIHKLFNREVYGSTSKKSNERHRKVLDRIPARLRFCLMDIVPIECLRNHIFMGFSQCGQFLLSFTFSSRTRGFEESTKYTLHFFSWVPGKLVKLVHSVPLFGDECVDSNITISMAQWKHNTSVLVVYGIAKHDLCSDRSYLSVIGVPQLGCRKCSSMSKEDDLSWGQRCLEHNFAIHTKFFCTSDSNIYEPVVHLAYSNQIVIYTDFIHVLEIDFVKPDHDKIDNLEEKVAVDREENGSVDMNPATPPSDFCTPFLSPKYQTNVVQNILADFSDLEMEPNQISRPVYLPDMMGQELCIQASSISHYLMEEWEGPSPSIRTLISPPLRSPRRNPAESMSRFNESHRVIADKAYEFVEETEKCEKLSMFRKRRLADKKYEFSEDNNENIIPFRVLRSNRKYFTGSTSKVRRAKSPSVESVVLRAHNQISRPASPTTSTDLKDTNMLMESDRNSESEYRVTEMLDDGSLKTVSVHDNTSKTLSDCPVSAQDPYLVHSGNSKCSKLYTRYFVESDDEITSILTDSDDDCISGYHVALPLTGHGASYTPLQAISSGAWDRLKSSSPPALPPLTLRAQQRSLDTELLCNEVCGRLCKISGKKFIYCFDWGCHVIDVCQSSGCLSGLCAMWLWASDPRERGEEDEGWCEACKDAAGGCVMHRRQYTAECLFTYNLVSGEYLTEKVAMTEDNSQEVCRESGAVRARELAKQLGPINFPPHENRLLTTLTGKSLRRLTDFDNCVEITKKHDDSSESEYSSDEISPSDDED